MVGSVRHSVGAAINGYNSAYLTVVNGTIIPKLRSVALIRALVVSEAGIGMNVSLDMREDMYRRKAEVKAVIMR
jgi:hypothetical protein